MIIPFFDLKESYSGFQNELMAAIADVVNSGNFIKGENFP